MEPWLSVIIPTYNGEQYLPAALDSIVAQGNLDIECIAVDDGSSDTTLSILDSYRGLLRLQVVQQQGQGWVANTNSALRMATAEWVCFLHQDDFWLEGRLATMKPLIEQYPQGILYLHSSVFVDDRGDRLGKWRCPLPSLIPLDASRMGEKLLIQNFIAIPAPIFRRDIALGVGGLDEQLWYTADWDFWMKLASCGYTVYSPRSLAAFRVHAQSQTILRSAKVQDFHNQLQIVLEKYLPQTSRFHAKLACFSIEMNTALAATVHGEKVSFWQLFHRFLSLGPVGWYQYLQNSRLGERVFARLRARIRGEGRKGKGFC